MAPAIRSGPIPVLSRKEDTPMRHSAPARSRAVLDNLRLDRRALLLGAGATAAATLLPVPALARQATPEATPAAMHGHAAAVPELELVGTDDGIQFPATVSAGINKVTTVNQRDGLLHLFTMRIPDDIDDDEAAAQMSGEDVPPWFVTTLFAGNPDEAPSGGRLPGYVNYLPGRYAVVDPFGSATAMFEVTGEAWGRPAPVADVEIALLDMAFKGFEASLPAGPHLWRVTNHGTMWHDVTVLSAPAGATVDDLWAAFDNTPEDQVFPDDYRPAGGIGATSPGVATWVEMDLAAGTYIAACFLPMLVEGPGAGQPHALLGMITAFEVA
jgi:hypothetical protein